MSTMLPGISFSFLVLFTLFSCKDSNSSSTSAPDPTSKEASDTLPAFDYDFAHEDRKYDPGKELKEISGLENLNDTILLCIQDEDGIVYFFNLQTEKVERKIKFHDKADFEGVTRVGDDIWVLESDGDLYQIKNYEKEDPKVEKYETRLSKDQDVEGLCFDKKNNRLLLACKDDAGKDMKDKKAVYAFDLDKKEIKKKPVILIDSEDIRKHVLDNKLDALSVKLRDALTLSGDKAFVKPSAIAIHPLDGRVFILSSRFSILVVLNPDYSYQRAIAIENNSFIQPEGITFTSNGDLFISNEGKKLSPNILKFTQRD